jgi:hypothetical protein
MNSAPRRLVDRMLDLAVFGPLGFALEARRLVPELAARGRAHIEAQVRTARALGQFAMQLGQRQTVASDTPPPPAAARPVPEIVVRVTDDLEPLPIEGYDALAASQVVARLAGLSPAELERVERYEAAHRGRRTILHRIAQLLPAR